MARERGQFNFSGNLEVKKTAPLDARVVVNTIAELISKATWEDTDHKVWLYDGLVVAVKENHGLYMLTGYDPVTAPGAYQTASNWKRIDAEAAAVTEIIDNLTSTDTDKALSANQGKVLDDKITAVAGDVSILKGDVSTPGSVAKQIYDVSTELTQKITDVSSALDSAVNEKLSKLTNVYIYKGSKDTYAELPSSTDVSIGWVYNVVAANGNTPAGTNYAWNGESWDALGGDVDLSAYALKTEVSTGIENVKTELTVYIDSSINTVKDTITTLTASVSTNTSNIETLQNTVASLAPDAENGPIKEALDALKLDISTYANSKYATKEALSLVDAARVANASAIEKLNGDENTVGSVANAIKSLDTSVVNKLALYVEKEEGKSLINNDKLQLIDTLNSSVTALETTVSNISTNLATTNDLVVNHGDRITYIEQALTWQDLPVM